MWEIILKMLLCLLIAVIIGGIIGWLWRSLFCKKRCDELEANLSDRDKELAELRLALSKVKKSGDEENTKDDGLIASLKTKISSLETDLSANAKLDSDWNGKYALLMTDLDGWKDRYSKLESDYNAQANVGGGWEGKYKTLEAELKSTKSDLSVCHERQVSVEYELRNWESKASLASVPAAALVSSAVVSDDGENDKLKAEIARLRVQINEAENEKTYLLGRVKKAESGESIANVVPMEQRDDLELVHGIGPVLERMLYDMGVYFFKDIAGWDAAKIAEITEQLPGFQGRIEREGWIESAKEEHFKKYGEKL